MFDDDALIHALIYSFFKREFIIFVLLETQILNFGGILVVSDFFSRLLCTNHQFLCKCKCCKLSVDRYKLVIPPCCGICKNHE